MSMSRKDYELIADAINEAATRPTTDGELDPLADLASLLAIRFKDSNPNFDPQKFINRCLTGSRK